MYLFWFCLFFCPPSANLHNKGSAGTEKEGRVLLAVLFIHREVQVQKVKNTYVKRLSKISSPLGGLSDVPKLQVVLLIENDQSCTVLPLNHICQIRLDTFISCHLAMKKCYNFPFPFYLWPIKSMQCNHKLFKIFLLLHSLQNAIKWCRYMFFQFWHNIILTTTSTPEMQSIKKQKLAQCSFLKTGLSCNSSVYPWLKHRATSHHTLPNHRVEALLWLGCEHFSASNSWDMSCLSFKVTLLWAVLCLEIPEWDEAGSDNVQMSQCRLNTQGWGDYV